MAEERHQLDPATYSDIVKAQAALAAALAAPALGAAVAVGSFSSIIEASSENLAALGTLDLVIPNGAAAFTGFLAVSSTLKSNDQDRTQTLYAVTGFGANVTVTALHTRIGTTAAAPFTITTPVAGTLRFTDTSGFAGGLAVRMAWFGAVANY
jgi:hypothetical protein